MNLLPTEFVRHGKDFSIGSPLNLKAFNAYFTSFLRFSDCSMIKRCHSIQHGGCENIRKCPVIVLHNGSKQELSERRKAAYLSFLYICAYDIKSALGFLTVFFDSRRGEGVA